MSPITQRNAAFLMMLSASPSLTSPLVARPSFGRVARNLLPFRCDVVPGDHAGLVDGIDCEWDWWAHTASDFTPQLSDQWDEASTAPMQNLALGTGNKEMDAGCWLLEQSTGPQAAACTFQNATIHNRMLEDMKDTDGSLTEHCSSGAFPITCIYFQDQGHDCQHESCQHNLQERTEHEWEHFDDTSEKNDYLLEHPDSRLMGCKHAFGDQWCYFESSEDPESATMTRFARGTSDKRTSPEDNGGKDDVESLSKEKRTSGCALTHDYRCDFFDNGILKHAICVFFNSEDKNLYIKTHPDFAGRPALCNLLNSGPGLVCGFDLKGSKLASTSGETIAAADTPEHKNVTTTLTTTRTSTIAKSRSTTLSPLSTNALAKSPRMLAAANFDSTVLVESVWPGTTSSTTTTTRKTMETIIPDYTRTVTKVVDVNQTSTSTSTTIMKTPYMAPNTLTRTLSQTVIQFSPVAETISVESARSTFTVWRTTTRPYLPCKTASCNHEHEEVTELPVCHPPTCLDSPEVKDCLRTNDDMVSHCDDKDDLCRCRAYDSRVQCFNSCDQSQYGRDEAQKKKSFYCTKAKAFPPLGGTDDKKAHGNKKNGTDIKSGALAPTIPAAAAFIAAVLAAVALLI